MASKRIDQARGFGLPRDVAQFYGKALKIGRTDPEVVVAMTTGKDVRRIVEFAANAQVVVEIGTAAGTTSLALALANPARTVWSYDPSERDRSPYMALVSPSVRDRVHFLKGRGDSLIDAPDNVEFIFIDGSHERADVVAEFRAWFPRLAPGAIVVFHDYASDWPGVVEAIAELDLSGKAEGRMYIWRHNG